MTNEIHKILIATFVLGFFMLNTQTVVAAPSFYKCSNGYSFKIKNDQKGVRCEKTTGDSVKPISCPNLLGVGTFPHSRSGKDRCAGRGAFTMEASIDPLGCPIGYSYKKNYQGNADKCIKAGKLTIQPPTKKYR